MQFDKDQISKIFEEISTFEVALEEDPTLPHLGTQYLQKVLSQCRTYLNRTAYYLQQLRIDSKNIKIELKIAEMDLEFKTKMKLAENPTVRMQSSISDREAQAASMLQEEHKIVSDLQLKLLGLQETIQILKFKHEELQRANQDIKTQKSLVKDDMVARFHGEGGYEAPTVNRDRSIPGGIPAPVVKKKIDPRDLLSPETKPEDVPLAQDPVHAQQIADFINNSGRDRADEKPTVVGIQYDDLLS